MKRVLKQLLNQTGLWPTAQAWRYHLSRFSPNSKHPRRRMVRFYSQFIAKGDLCYDVGSNIGEHTDVFLELGARVVSIEPQRACLEVLNHRFRNNRNVVMVGKGLAAKSGVGVISICDQSPVLSTLSQKWQRETRFSVAHGFDWNRSETVELTTLDELIKVHGKPTFCKIDVEGYEVEVLKGLSQPIDRLSFEFCREMLEETRACIEHLTGLGPYRFLFRANEPSGPVFHPWVEAQKLFDVLNANPDPHLWGDIYASLERTS